MMSVRTFLDLVDLYCSATKVAEATLASRLFNDGKRIGQLRAGADIGTRRLERALQWLSDNWPADAAWPEGVDRPLPTEQPEAAE